MYNNSNICASKCRSDSEKNIFYEQVQQVLDDTPNHDIKLKIGVFSAHICNNSIGWEGVLGTEVEGIQADNSKRFLNLCGTNTLMIGDRLLQHKRTHMETSDNVTVTQDRPSVYT